jgi:ferric iron reductase protein FhuF
VLAGNAASALVGTARVLGWGWPLAERALARGWLAGALAGSRRTTCCLYYRVPGGGLCGDCVLDRVPGG